MKKVMKPVARPRGRSQTLEDRKEFRDPSAAKLVQPVEDPRFEAPQDHAISTLDLPVHPGCATAAQSTRIW
jgi:hypothetical protein